MRTLIALAAATATAAAADMTITIRDVVITDGVTVQRCAVVVTTATGCAPQPSPSTPKAGMPKDGRTLPASQRPRVDQPPSPAPETPALAPRQGPAPRPTRS